MKLYHGTGVVAVYLLWAFVSWQFNPAEWGMNARFFGALGAAWLEIGIILFRTDAQ